MITFLIRSMPIVLSLLLISDMVAQPAYRITPDGKYQYIEEPATAFDETSGVYYRDITIRTFFLETHRLGLIPDSLLYEDFTAMTLEGQQAILKQFRQQSDCSSNNITLECLVFNPSSSVFNPPPSMYRNQQAQVMDLSKKCRRTKYGKDSLTQSGKMVVTPSELPKCNENYLNY